MDNQNMNSLSDKSRSNLNKILSAIGVSCDEIEISKYQTITPDHARGYLECFIENADDEKVLFTYFIISRISAKIN